MRWLLLALIVIPAIEIAIFIKIGGLIGPWWVITLIFLSALIGFSFAKKEGNGVWIKARQSIEQRRVPTEEIVDGICILIGAIFLFTPGFVTDTIGLLLIIPWTRQPFKSLCKKWVLWNVSKGKIITRK